MNINVLIETCVYNVSMSQITIQCRLIACESTRHQLWKFMAEANTPLINELLAQVARHPDFKTWRQRGKLPTGIVSQLCQPLKVAPPFIGQSARFYASAIHLASYTYRSWLALQKRLHHQLEGQVHWLGMLSSDAELVEASSCSLDTIRAKASEILAQATLQNAPANSQLTQTKKGNKARKPRRADRDRSVSDVLFEVYRATKDCLSCCAISYLLKNGCKISNKAEDLEKFAKRRRKVEIRIRRLTEQLEGRMPKGRDLAGQKWLETLATATITVPQDEAEARRWQDMLLTQPSSLPFPIVFETNEDMIWSKDHKGRLCVHFNGFSEHTFKVYCDRRQLLWFQRFLEDQQTKRGSRGQYSSGLFTLRSGQIAWQAGEGKGHPWNIHRLTLFCTVDTRLWSAEGTEQVRQEKAVDVTRKLTQMKDKGDLSQSQEGYVKRLHSTLARMNSPFNRPSQPLYHGQSHILIGVSLGLDQPASVAAVDAGVGKVLTYRSVRQLLKENYNLLNRQRQQQQCNSHQRHKAQKYSAPNHVSESELGQYVDRLLAKEIVAIAQTYRAASIVLPKLGDIREIIQTEIRARAEQKCPGYEEGQKKYAKQYRTSLHRWSYGRLIENIQSQAAKTGIAIEKGQQPIRGSPQEKAKELALSAYQSRLESTI